MSCCFFQRPSRLPCPQSVVFIYSLLLLCLIVLIASFIKILSSLPDQTSSIHTIQSFQYLVDKQINTNNDQSIIDYNSLFTRNALKKDYTKINKSPKKISFIFIVGLEGSGHHWMATFFDNLLDNALYQANYGLDDKILIDAMANCFAYGQYNKPAPSNFKYPHNMSKSDPETAAYLKLSSCDAVKKRFNYYSETMWNNTVLFHCGLSFPFGPMNIDKDSYITHYPDILQMIEWAQNAKPYPFDVRIIYLYRNWQHSMLSVVRRYGNIQQRIEILQHMMNMIQTQLISIDQQFWIGINMDDLFKRMQDYIDIFCMFLGPYLTQFDVETAMKFQMKDKHKPHDYSKGFKDVDNVNKNEWNVLNQMLKYETKWSLLSSNDILVTPENLQFLADKHFAKCRPPQKPLGD